MEEQSACELQESVETRLKFKPPSDRVVREMSVYLIDPRTGEREDLGHQLY